MHQMLTYLLVQWVEASENSCIVTTTNKKTTTTGPTGWRAGRDTSVQLLTTMMSLPLPSLWDPPSPSMLDDLASLVASCAYKLLESPAITRDKALLDKTLDLLGCLVRDYGQGSGKNTILYTIESITHTHHTTSHVTHTHTSHNLTHLTPHTAFNLKVPQLLRNFEHLVSPLATAVVMVAKDYGVPSVVSGVIRCGYKYTITNKQTDLGLIILPVHHTSMGVRISSWFFYIYCYL